MASDLSQQIQCSVCLNDLTDPVSLPCEHSFCRKCINRLMKLNSEESKCPECRSSFSRKDVRANRLLRNMVEAAQSHLEQHEALKKRTSMIAMAPVPQNDNSSDVMCPKHKETFKLFCETDQKLVCFICREEVKHQGHEFKTMNYAAKTDKARTSETLALLFNEDRELTDLLQRQAEEIDKTKERSKTISAQISAQFEEMHQFLREKEEEVKKQLEEEEKELLEEMEENVSEIKELLSDGREEQGILLSALEIEQCSKFLEWWGENGQSLIEGIQSDRITPKAESLGLKSDSLFLGPYETHLKFFVWKEMLRSIKPVPHHDIMEDKKDPYLSMSPSGRSVQRTTKKGAFGTKKHHLPFTQIAKSYVDGQHYFEVEVGETFVWVIGAGNKEHGFPNIFLTYSVEEGYSVFEVVNGAETERDLTDIKGSPRKIGVYLDCERKQVLFYNADNMTLMHTTKFGFNSPYSLYLSPGPYLSGWHSDPMTLCWY